MDAHRLVMGSVALAGVGIALVGIPLPAHAVTQRTFVASNGSDTNACSLAAPCRGFTRAMTQTADKGEIIVLDSAGYGAVVIDKSVSIIAPPGVYAGISVFTGNGVTIATAGVKVLLRGLNINGQGGSIGIDFSAGGGAELVVEQCTIANMAGAGLSASNASSRIIVRDAVVRHNGGNGITVAQATVATIDRTRVERNTGTGIRFMDGAWGTVSEATISGNGQHGVFAESQANVLVQISIDRSVIVENGLHGAYASVISSGTGEVRMVVSRSTLARNSGNGVGVLQIFVGPAHVEISENEITGNGQAGIEVYQDTLSTVLVHVAGNRVTRNAYGFSTNVTLRSLGNNLIEDNTNPDSGTIAIVSNK